MSVHRRRLSEEGVEAGLSRKQRQDRKKQRVSPPMHNSWHQAPVLLNARPGLALSFLRRALAPHLLRGPRL